MLSLKAANFDGDGETDLLGLPYSSVPRIYWNDGTGAFPDSLELTALGEVDEVHVGDFNGDGAPDILAQYHLQPFQVLLNEGGSRFSSPLAINSRGLLVRECLVAAEWDAQPGADVIWSSDQLYVARWSPAGWDVRVLHAQWDWNQRDFRLATTDVNGDGRTDLVLLRTGMIYLQTADGILEESPLEDQEARIEAAGDFDEDGRCDLLVSGMSAGLSIISRDSTGRWRQRGRLPFHGDFLVETQLADLDGDGSKDLCVRQTGFYSMGCYGAQPGWLTPSNWQVLLRTPSGWTLRESQPVDDAVSYPGVIAHFDASPYPDLVVKDQEGIGISLIRDPFR